jgi:hypothetical protein
MLGACELAWGAFPIGITALVATFPIAMCDVLLEAVQAARRYENFSSLQVLAIHSVADGVLATCEAQEWTDSGFFRQRSGIQHNNESH